jgi:hypothetical protein
MTDLVVAIASGTARSLPEDFDNQRFNDEQVALAQMKTVEQLMQELEDSYAHLIRVLETLKQEQLEVRGVHPATGDTTLKEFLLVTYAHEETHTREIIDQARRLRKMAASN